MFKKKSSIYIPCKYFSNSVYLNTYSNTYFLRHFPNSAKTYLVRLAVSYCAVITRPHRMLTVKSRPLASDVAWSVCLCVCLLNTAVNRTKRDEPIKISFGLWNRVGAKNRACWGSTELLPSLPWVWYSLFFWDTVCMTASQIHYHTIIMKCLLFWDTVCMTASQIYYQTIIMESAVSYSSNSIRTGFKGWQTGQLPRSSTTKGPPQKQ